MLSLLGAFVVMALALGAAVLTYYAISFLVLAAVSRLFPIAGRRRRRRRGDASA